MFGIARQPGHVYFDPRHDVLYFGPRAGYMAAEAQLRTLLVLTDPEELGLVQRVALSESVLDHTGGAGASTQASTNLAVDVLHQLRTRLPNLRELIVVPRGESNDPVDDGSSSDAVLVPLSESASSEVDMVPSTEATNCLAKQIHTAMRRVCAAAPGWTPPRWRILVNTSRNGETAPSQCVEEASGHCRTAASHGRSKRQGKEKSKTSPTTACNFCEDKPSRKCTSQNTSRGTSQDCRTSVPSLLCSGHGHRSRR